MKNRMLIVTPRTIRGVAIAALWIGIGAYFGWHVYNLFRAPLLVVENPPRDIITQDGSLALSGRAQKETDVTVNGAVIDAEKDGTFHDTITLQDGMNVIEVRAVNKFGKETTVVRRVVKQ